jgi:hypothetical protein
MDLFARTVASLGLALALAPLACGKKKDGTTVPGDEGGGEAGQTDGPDVPQEPDPPQIADAAHQVIAGKYPEAIAVLQPLYADLKERKQWRASGLAGGWLAVAHAQTVVENADEPSAHAIAMADKTGDAEVVAVAKLARGSYLLFTEDFAAAEKALADAAAAKPDTSPSTYAIVLRANALISGAFEKGDDDDERLVRPENLDTARTALAGATEAAKKTADAEALLGRIEEGLAGLADYKKDKPTVCKHAEAALGHYKAAQASSFLIEGPTRLASSARCSFAPADGG